MKLLHVDSLPVCDGRRLLGTITNRDIATNSTAYGHDPNDTLVRDCMNSEIVYCFEDQESNEAERIMQEKQIRRLLVLTREKELVGILALGDLATKTGETRSPMANASAGRLQVSGKNASSEPPCKPGCQSNLPPSFTEKRCRRCRARNRNPRLSARRRAF